MRRVLRAFLVWVMVIAMPVQGMAASAMLFCDASHARMGHERLSAAPAAGVGDAAAAVHHAAAPGHHGHAAPGAMPAAGAAPLAAADGGQGSLAQPADVSCSACAACCAAMALPAGFDLPAIPGPAQAVHASPDAPVRSHAPDGLDPPPRTAHA